MSAIGKSIAKGIVRWLKVLALLDDQDTLRRKYEKGLISPAEYQRESDQINQLLIIARGGSRDGNNKG